MFTLRAHTLVASKKTAAESGGGRGSKCGVRYDPGRLRAPRRTTSRTAPASAPALASLRVVARGRASTSVIGAALSAGRSSGKPRLAPVGLILHGCAMSSSLRLVAQSRLRRPPARRKYGGERKTRVGLPRRIENQESFLARGRPCAPSLRQRRRKGDTVSSSKAGCGAPVAANQGE